MRIHVQGERCRRMAEVFLNRFDIVAIFDRGNGVAMPLRYNYDKPEKPRINKVFVRMFFRFRIMRYGIGYAIPHFLSRE